MAALGQWGVLYCPGHAGVGGNDRADRLAGTQHWNYVVYCPLDMPESEEMTEQIDWLAHSTGTVGCTVLHWTYRSRRK